MFVCADRDYFFFFHVGSAVRCTNDELLMIGNSPNWFFFHASMNVVQNCTIFVLLWSKLKMYGYGVGPIDLPVLLKRNLIISMGNLSLAQHHKVAYKRKRTRYTTPRIIFDAWSLYLYCAVFYRKLNSCMPYCVQHASPITSSRHRCFVVPVRPCYTL